MSIHARTVAHAAWHGVIQATIRRTRLVFPGSERVHFYAMGRDGLRKFRITVEVVDDIPQDEDATWQDQAPWPDTPEGIPCAWDPVP